MDHPTRSSNEEIPASNTVNSGSLDVAQVSVDPAVHRDGNALDSDNATESIQQSLDLLNMEYGDAGSPAKSSAAEDVFVDRPIFDATPARCPPSVDGAIINSDRTQAGPVFDTTPMPCNKGDAPDFDSTPVYQDTPSQSVDGTEEVTQEYMVQEQLSRYEKAHAARVAAHGEKLTVYYRKKEAKLKNVKQTAPVQMPVLHEEPDKTATAEQPRKKPRVAVAKRCVSRTSPSIPPVVSTPRRSPRIINTSQPSPSPDKARPTKRARAADKTYVPDGDDTDFEDDADKLKRAREVGRRSGLGVPNVDPNNKPRASKKAKVHTKGAAGGIATAAKPQVRKKKSDVDECAAKKRFQQTVRCSLGEVTEAAKLLKDNHREKVRLAGFGCVFDWVLEGNVSRVLMCYLMMIIDTKTMKIQCGSGKVLDVNRDSVHQVFGFPIGGDTVPKPADSGHDESLAMLKAELGFDKNASIETKELRKLLATLVEDPERTDLAVKVFFAILFNKLICPGSAVRLGREAPMLVNLDYEKMANMDYCQLVVDELRRAADKYQDRSIPQAGPEGCGIVPTVMYLDCCHSVKHSVMHTKTPRANFLHEKPLRDIYNLDILKNGGSELSQYRFGKLGWKGRNQIAYSYRIPVEELYIDSISRSTVRSSDIESNPVPLATSQPELLVNQAPAGSNPATASKHASASTSGASASLSTIDEIVQLMKKVDDLSRSIPTTADHVSRLSCLFPSGCGPSADSVREQAQHEANLLESLRLAASMVRTGYSEFGMKQDSLLRDYQRAASLLGSDSGKHAFAEAGTNTTDSGIPLCSGLGQSAEDAEAEAKQAEEAAAHESEDGFDHLDNEVMEVDTELHEHSVADGTETGVKECAENEAKEADRSAPFEQVDDVASVANLDSKCSSPPVTPPHDYSPQDDDTNVLNCVNPQVTPGVADGELPADDTDPVANDGELPADNVAGESADVVDPICSVLEEPVAGEEFFNPLGTNELTPSTNEEEAIVVSPTDAVVRNTAEEVHRTGVHGDIPDYVPAPEHGVLADSLDTLDDREELCAAPRGVSEDDIVALSPSETEVSPVDIVSSPCATPRVSALPAMKRIKDVYHALCRLRKDPVKREQVIFANDDCECTIGQLAEAFKPYGYLCSFTISVGTYLLGQKYKNSEKMVVPYVCSRQICEGNLVSRRVKKLFGVDAEERLDKKEIILFATFDPPDSPLPGAVGHYCVVALNLAKKRFELLDSLRGSNDPDGKRVLFSMAKNIKKVWKASMNSKGETLVPNSINDFEMHYVKVPRQGDGHSCGFFVLQILQSYDGDNLVNFSQDDIPNIRMTLLYSWLTAADFNIDLQSMIGVSAGEPLGLEEDNFALFETQFYTPEVEVMVHEDFVYHDSKAKKAVDRINSVVRKTKQKKQSASGDKKKADVVSLDDDLDDFTSQFARQMSVKRDAKDVNPSPADSSDDFQTQKCRVQPPQELVLSNKRPSKVSTKLRVEVPKFIPYSFPHLNKAKSLKELVLSKEFLQDHKDHVLVKFTSPNGIPLEIDGKSMYKQFGRAEMMEAEVMDYIISFWKDDPDMKSMFDSGDRVVLGPFTIPYLLDWAPFDCTDESGNVKQRSEFNVKQAAKEFKHYVRKTENLLKANLIFIPHYWLGHHSVYVMNKYTGTVDIFDSRRYALLKHTSRNKHHQHRTEIMSRMVALMKEVYGTSEYNKHNVPQWELIAERCNFVKSPEQGANECGFYSLKFIVTYDGVKIVEKIKNKDSRVEQWKAEHMYQLMFHPMNEIAPLQWPSELQDLLLLLGLGSQSTQELVSKAVQERGVARVGE